MTILIRWCKTEFFNLAQHCKNEGEIFMECGLSCARSCRDLSRDIKCNEECVSGCQCPNGELRNDEKRCVPVAECPCQYEGKTIQAGENVDVGNCKTWYGPIENSISPQYCNISSTYVA